MENGRPRKPTQLKVLDGDRKDRINRSEPVPTGEIKPPAHLSLAARGVWDEMAPDRIRQGVLTAWDVEAFAAFCSAVVQLRRANWESALEFSKPGQESPMSKLRQLVNICATLGCRFGWTPADRAKLTLPGSNQRDQAQDLLSG